MRDVNGTPVLDYQRVLVPPARNLASYKRAFKKAWEPENPPPKEFKKIGCLKKGDIVRIPFNSNWEISFDQLKIQACLFYRVVMIRADGRVGFSLAEFMPKGLQESPWNHLEKSTEFAISESLTLSKIISFNL